MGTYYNNTIQIVKKKKDGSDNGFSFEELKVIRDVLLESMWGTNYETFDIKCFCEVFDINEPMDNNISSILNYILIDGNNLTIGYTEKGVDFRLVKDKIVNKLKSKYTVNIITMDLHTPSQYEYLFNERNDMNNKIRIYEYILSDIVTHTDTTDEILKKIISSENMDIIKKSLRNPNILDETIDDIFNKYLTNKTD